MMTVDVRCTQCSSLLHVPVEASGKRVRCNHCGQVVAVDAPSLEDTVLDWLTDEPAAAPVATVTSPRHPAVTAGLVAETIARAAPPAANVELETLRLVRVDDLGASFAFSADMLNKEEFRASMPRCCQRCGSKTNLTVHLIVWLDKLAEERRSKLLHGVKVRIAAEQLAELDSLSLLKFLPRVPDLPVPFNLPMPYFMCGNCSPAGLINCEVRPARSGDECVLNISSHRRAADFLANNLGPEHPDYHRLVRAYCASLGEISF